MIMIRLCSSDEHNRINSSYQHCHSYVLKDLIEWSTDLSKSMEKMIERGK